MPDPTAESPGAKPPLITPAHDVQITVQLPDFLPKVEVFEALPEGLKPYPAEQHGRTLRLDLDELVDGRIFLIRRR